MKAARKLVGILLALMMVATMIIPAMAAQEGTLTDGKITIDNAVVGQKYSAYQLLYIESYNASTDSYSYKANSAWAEWLATQTTYLTIDTQGYVTWVENADAAAFAKAAQAYAAEHSIAADATATATSTTVEFTGLKLGYYLVDTTLGTLCSLDTTNPTAIIKEKNVAPTNEKTVEEDSTGKYGATNDADLGQTVNFKSTITAQAGAENYVFHDKMSAGLTYLGITSVKLNGTDIAASDYTVKTEGFTDGCTFEIEFKQTFCDTLKKDDKIEIAYTAKLNENAVIGLDGNPNESKLSYGDSTGVSAGTNVTPPSETITYTWDLDVLKYANGNESTVLAGAQFVLLNKTKDKVAKFADGKFASWEDIPAAEGGVIAWPAGTVLTTGADGKISVDGLDADDYKLREVKAPDGFNKLSSDIDVKIEGAKKDADSDVLTYTTKLVKVNNQSGTELPSTGGMGTTVFYIIGGVLIAAAVVLLITKKRMSAER